MHIYWNINHNFVELQSNVEKILIYLKRRIGKEKLINKYMIQKFDVNFKFNNK